MQSLQWNGPSNVWSFHAMVHKAVKHLFPHETKIEIDPFQDFQIASMKINGCSASFFQPNLGIPKDLFEFFFSIFKIMHDLNSSHYSSGLISLTLSYVAEVLEHRFDITLDRSTNEENPDLFSFHFIPDSVNFHNDHQTIDEMIIQNGKRIISTSSDFASKKKRKQTLEIVKRCNVVDFQQQSHEFKCMKCESLRNLFNDVNSHNFHNDSNMTEIIDPSQK